MEKLVSMANQIGRFFTPQRADTAQAVSTHLSRFWDPGMRMAIIAYLQDGGAGLDIVVEDAIRQLPEFERSNDPQK